MKAPAWLYLKREGMLDTIYRFGSRRPLRFVLTVIKDGVLAGGQPTTILLAAWRLHFSYGAADEITEGLSSLDARWWHLFESKNGMGLLVAWEKSRRSSRKARTAR